MQKSNRSFALFLLIGLALLTTACSDFFVSGSTLDHINLTPSAVFLKTGEQVQISANAVNVDGTTSDATSSATWTTAASNVATVAAGLVKAVGTTGSNTTVTATQSGVSGVANVVVGTQALNTTLTVTPNNPTVAANQTVQLTATGTAGSSLNLTNFVTWTSSNTTNATVSNTGLVTGLVSGQTATITATIATATSSATGSVTVTVQ